MSIFEISPAALLRCFAVSVLAASLGVAGGELLILTLLLLFSVDIKRREAIACHKP